MVGYSDNILMRVANGQGLVHLTTCSALFQAHIDG